VHTRLSGRQLRRIRLSIAQAVEIALRETQAELGNNEIIERITFACFGDDVWLTYQSALKRIHEQN